MSEYAISVLCGSPALLFMYISASAPDAPPLSETTIGCFIRLFFWMAACIILAIWSEAPPAPAATTISTGLLGSHAKAGAAVSASPASALARKPISLLMSFLLFDFRTACLSRPARRCLGAVRKIFHRRANPFSLYWNAGKRQAHFHAGQRAHQGEVVEVAEMPDAEHLAAELAQAGAERHAERFAQAVKQIRRRRIGEIAGLAVGDHFVPGPVAARQAGGFGGGQRLGRDAVERQPRRQH